MEERVEIGFTARIIIKGIEFIRKHPVISTLGIACIYSINPIFGVLATGTTATIVKGRSFISDINNKDHSCQLKLREANIFLEKDKCKIPTKSLKLYYNTLDFVRDENFSFFPPEEHSKNECEIVSQAILKKKDGKVVAILKNTLLNKTKCKNIDKDRYSVINTKNLCKILKKMEKNKNKDEYNIIHKTSKDKKQTFRQQELKLNKRQEERLKNAEFYMYNC